MVAYEHTLISALAGNGRFFGFSVSVSGDTFAVGDPKDNFEFKRNQVRVFLCCGKATVRERDGKGAHMC